MDKTEANVTERETPTPETDALILARVLENKRMRMEKDFRDAIKALRAIVDQEQHDGQPETHMHDMADIARAFLASLDGGKR